MSDVKKNIKYVDERIIISENKIKNGGLFIQ